MRTALLLLASLFICSWGSTESLVFLLVSILINWVFGFMLSSRPNTLSLAIVWNVAFLVLFKFMGVTESLPVGISYYTLSAISYCIDVARKDAGFMKNPAKLALYIAFFPKLIMGPVVLYKDFEQQIDWPSVNADMVADGMFKFVIGLGKKLIIAGSLAEMTSYCWADACYATASAWLAIIGFSLQLYYDFSGYSDMAIGLSKMLGFEVQENFMYPYEASTLTSFWSRWHIALSRWFKDYVYFPMGGNRRGESRTMFNLFVVWLATGIWHGNGMNYVFWGLFLYLFLSFEKKKKWGEKIPRVLGIIITDFIVMMGWVLFNSKSTVDAIEFYGYLIGESEALVSGISSIYWYSTFPWILIAAVGCTSFPKTCAKQIFPEDSMITTIAKCVFMLAVLGVSSYYLVINGYTPFIYQSF